MQGDKDAVNLFNLMQAPPVDDPSFFKKRDRFIDYASNKIFDLICKVSKNATDHGSCTLIVYSSSFSLIYPENRHLLMGINDQSIAAHAASKFVNTDTYGQIFKSNDNHLSIMGTKNSDGQVVSFTITYSE